MMIDTSNSMEMEIGDWMPCDGCENSRVSVVRRAASNPADIPVRRHRQPSALGAPGVLN